MSALQPYLPRLVLDWHETMPDALVREIDGSMVFVDVSGFTKMSERLARQGKVGAEEVSDVIGETFGGLLAEAYSFGGSLIKFGGDALLLFFEGPEHSLRAVAAAHGMRRELRSIGTFATTAGKVILRMSVGAHTGLFHFFLVGESHRELIVAGPAATETVTMEGAASAGQILLSPALAATLPSANRGRRLGPGVLLAGTPPEPATTPIERLSTAIDLTPFVARGLRETLQEGEVEPEHRVVTIAFVHYGGFDDLVLHQGSAVAAAALESLVVAAQRAVDDRGVTFLSTDVAPDGGKIILTAGAPVVTGADEEQMLLAVRDVVAADIALPLHIGVNSGPVFAGTIGPSYRRTYTVMGDAVNLAARLMAKAEHGQIVATPPVLDGSRTLFSTQPLTPFLVKGKKEPIDASVVGPARGSRASIAAAGLPLIGREDELETLAAAWGRAAAGEGAVVEITAEPGMGKSRLLQEFLSLHPEVDVLRGECRLYQAATPYFPFRALLSHAFGLEGLGDDAAVAALRDLVDEQAPVLTPWLSLIGTPLGLEIPPSREVEELEDEFRRVRLEEVVSTLLHVVADEPTIVLVEDTHWMDEPSRDLVARLTSELGGHPWLMLLSRRPSAERSDSDATGLVRIDLQPLASAHAIALIESATEDAPLMPQNVRSLAERAAGNPLFLLELLDALRRGEDVAGLPTSVEGLIQARIDRLPVADRVRLREVSVLGSSFRIEHIVSALADGRTIAQVRPSLARLGDFLAVNDTGWVRFHHALIRDAAYEGLPYAKRKTLHARVGDSILVAAGDAPEEQAELLSLHYSAAGRWEEAWTYSRLAGDDARRIYANLEAARFYERALAAAPRVGGVDAGELAEVALRLGEAREHAGLFAAALDGLERARRLAAGDALALADVRYRRARVLMHMGSFRTAYRETTRGRREIESLPGVEATRARARLTRLSSALRLMEGRPGDARVLADEAARGAELAGDELELASAFAVLNAALEDLGDPDAAEYAEKALEVYARIGELPGVGQVEMSIGVHAYAEGRWDDAVTAYLRAQNAFQRAGNETRGALAAANIGEVLVSQGRFAEAEPLLAETIRVLRAHANVGPALFCEIQIGRLMLGTGGLDEAVATLARTRDEAAAIGIRGLALEAGIHLAAALTRQGDHERALEILDAEAERAGDLVVALGGALACARAETLLAIGRPDEAAAVVTSGLGLSTDDDASYDRARLLVLAGRLGRGRGETAAEALQEAGSLLQRLGVIAVPVVYGNAR